MKARNSFPLALVLTCVLLLLAAPQALAHAQLLGTSPASGTTVQTQPQTVIFKFNQDVGGTDGAVRVYDSQGNEVDNLEVSHPDANEHWMGVGLKPHLPDGTYTATYRVISADTHIVYGGLVFNLGHPSASSKITVAGLISKDESGHVTKVAFGVVRALDYLALGLGAGGLVFMLLVWPRALASSAAGGDRRRRAARALASRLDRMLALAVVLGAIVSVLGVLLQGASAAGVSLWTSLKGSLIESTLETRFGWVWTVRALVWLALGLLLLATRGVRRRSWLSAGAPGEDPTADKAAPSGLLTTAIASAFALAGAYLLATPALAGHASIESPRGVFFPSDVIHVAAGSVWVGGITCLLFVLPSATHALEDRERTGLLLATLKQLSPLALAAVVAIAVTGVVQAYIDVHSVDALFNTTYGVLILAKTGLLLALIGLGWVNRQRIIPALERIAAAASAPGSLGVQARRTLRGELALMICVFGVTAALISYAPPIDAASGPFSINTTIGAAELEMSVEPAEVGPNTIHLYLIDAKSGAQYTATKELTATAKLPAKGIGPLQLHPSAAGPGHYVLNSAVLSPAGTWQIEIVDRVSEFEQFTQVVKVPIR
jgi:copper transport protein